MSQFTQVPMAAVPSNTFDLSHHVNLSCDGGLIIPVKCIEALPGDSFSYNNKTFVRLSPMVSPPFSKMDVTMITGFIPIRLLWPNMEKFFGNPVPDENTPVAPYLDNIIAAVGSLPDYMGVPTYQYRSDNGTIEDQYTNLDGLSALPFAAYQKFYNDWFRDENLINNGEETFTPLVDGLNPIGTLLTLRRRAWRHDYFTSNLPFAQKGDAVEIPLGTFAPVNYSNPDGRPTAWETINGGTPGTANYTVQASVPSSFAGPDAGDSLLQGSAFAAYNPNGTLIADLSQAAAVTINTLRWAEKLQVFLEKNARGGTRYTEIVRQHFNQRSSDARLQRAEFLGFSVNPVIISEVLQTSPSQEDTTPLAEMAGHGISYGGSKFVNYHAEEHGFFMTMISIRPKTSYMQGLSRMWSRKSPLDYAWPTFAQLGEQETKNKELFITGTPDDEGTFGYLPRYAEYRYEGDRVAGEMRTSYTHWHMTRIFDALPLLNSGFIECVPTKRIFAVNSPGVHSYLISVSHNLSVRRCLPKFGIPAL